MWTSVFRPDRFAVGLLRGVALFAPLLLATAVVRQDMPGDKRMPGIAASTVDPELQRAAERANLCSDSNLTGVGLRGEYYAQAQWQGPLLLARTDPGIDFDFDSGFDIPASLEAARRPKSVRWTGWIKPPVTGRYRFHLGAGGAIITVAHKVFSGQTPADETFVELNAGRYAPVLVEMGSLPTGAERMRLEWTTPYGARFVVPRALLYLPSETVATTVSQAGL